MDPAKLRGAVPSGARHNTGAMEFVVIEVLQPGSVPHSLFNVVVWIWILYGGAGKPWRKRPLASEMVSGELQRIVNQYGFLTICWEELSEEQVLFPPFMGGLGLNTELVEVFEKHVPSTWDFSGFTWQ